MARFIKIVGWAVFIIIFLAVAAVLIALRLFDPNDFKPTIIELARENAALDLHIPGEMSWQLWPYLGISLGRTEARIADQEALFAAVDSATTSVAVLPLFKGQVQLSGITVSGLEVNLEETAEGANWDPIVAALAAEETAAPSEPETDSALDIPLTIPLVAIENGRLRYRNSNDGTDIIIDQLFLNATDVDLKQAFPVELSLRYQDQADMRVELAASTQVQLDLAQEIYRADGLHAAINLAGVTLLPVDVELAADINANLGADTVTLDNLSFAAAGIRGTGQVAVSQLSGDMQFAGQLATDDFNANSVLKNIGEAPIETTNPNALSRLNLKATLNGPAGSLMLNPLTLQLDDSTVTGNAGLTNLALGALGFDLALDHIQLDGYLPPATEETPELNEGKVESVELLPVFSDAPLLPLADLRALLVNGKLAIGKVAFDTLEASELALAISAKDGLLALDSFQGKTLGGSLNASAALDARSDTPQLRFDGDFKQLQLQPLVNWALEQDLFMGLTDIKATFRASGNSEKALAESGQGKVDFTLTDGTVRGLNLYNTLLTGVNDMLGAYSMLASFIPGQESGKLPLELSEDTRIVELFGTAAINNLVAEIKDLRAELNRGTLTGNGKLNLATQAFDLRLGIHSPEITTNQYLKDTVWPLRCKGNLAGAPAQWCGHDNQGFRDIGKQVAADVTRDQLKDRLGISAEGDTTEEILKNVAKDKAQEEVEKAKDSVREKATQELQRLFNR